MSKQNIKHKIIAVVGTTASGKTSLGVNIAFKFNGEIISADSRQVYKYMDVGTGKDLKEYSLRLKAKNSPVLASGQKLEIIKIPYHCIDLAHPQTEFSLGKWHRQALKAIIDIQKRGKLPIVVGGSGLYVQALLDNYGLTKVAPNRKLRLRLAKLSVGDLLIELKKLDKDFANSLDKSGQKNKRRLIRYIEIRSRNISNGTSFNARKSKIANKRTEFEALVVGITWPKEELKKRIKRRLFERLEKEGMVGEVARLRKVHRVSWKRLIDFGLEYKFITFYLQKRITYDEMVEQLDRATYQFARRQMTWLRRWERQGRAIIWVESRTEAIKYVKKFI